MNAVLLEKTSRTRLALWKCRIEKHRDEPQAVSDISIERTIGPCVTHRYTLGVPKVCLGSRYSPRIFTGVLKLMIKKVGLALALGIAILMILSLTQFSPRNSTPVIPANTPPSSGKLS